MRRTSIVLAVTVGVLIVSGLKLVVAGAAAAEPQWSINMSNIEACSCTMFCPCYFTSQPTHHHGEAAMAYCRFNNAFKINQGKWGDTSLDGLKIWMSGDLGGDFSKPPLWIHVTFEASATPEQRLAAKTIIAHIFMQPDPSALKEMPDAKIDWMMDKDGASAKLDDGKAAEIVLKRSPGMTDDPVKISNLKFWAAPRNDGFLMMGNEIQAYRLGDKPFETKGTNGFFVTIDMNSEDLKK